MSNYIKKLEGYGDLEVSIIRATKINKVLKALIKLNTIPKDEEFNFRGRSVELLGRWNKILGSEGAGDGDGAGPSGGEKEERPTTNGLHKSDEKLETSDAPAEATAELSNSTDAANAAPEASAVAKEVVVNTHIKEPATSGGLEDAQKPEEEPKKDKDLPEPVKADQAPESAAGAAQVAEIIKATE